MEWSLAHPLEDIDEIVALAETSIVSENDGVLEPDMMLFRKHVMLAALEQAFDPSKQFLAVCRGDKTVRTMMGTGVRDDALLGFCWFDRGSFTTYCGEEISGAKFYQLDMQLSPRTRVEIIHQMIDQHILWANNWGIPIITSTSIRDGYEGFMRIHEKRGFMVRGSHAWVRTEKALKILTGEDND